MLRRYVHLKSYAVQCFNTSPSLRALKTILCAVLSRSVVSDSMQLLKLRPTRILCPWDSPGKNTGVGCYALLQGDLPNPGIKPTSLVSPTLAGGFFATHATWEALWVCCYHLTRDLMWTDGIPGSVPAPLKPRRTRHSLVSRPPSSVCWLPLLPQVVTHAFCSHVAEPKQEGQCWDKGLSLTLSAVLLRRKFFIFPVCQQENLFSIPSKKQGQ